MGYCLTDFFPKSATLLLRKARFTLIRDQRFEQVFYRYTRELHFIKSLKTFEQFDVVEPGVVRQQLLTLRITFENPSLID